MGMFSELKKIEEQKIEEKKKTVPAVASADSPPLPVQKKTQKPVRKPQNKQDVNKTSNIVSNITILQYNE